jgi:predicted DCC family thiol-disulfide oxidoreductase YuxK
MIWAQLDAHGNVEEFEIRSAAALRIAGYLGGWWSLLVAFWIIPRPVRDWMYNVIARHRHKLVRPDVCFQMPPDSSHRFLES